MNSLHGDTNCTDLVHDILDLISGHLLRVRAEMRWDSTKIVERMKEIYKNCDIASYYTDRSPVNKPRKVGTHESDEIAPIKTHTVETFGGISRRETSVSIASVTSAANSLSQSPQRTAISPLSESITNLHHPERYRDTVSTPSTAGRPSTAVEVPTRRQQDDAPDLDRRDYQPTISPVTEESSNGMDGIVGPQSTSQKPSSGIQRDTNSAQSTGPGKGIGEVAHDASSLNDQGGHQDSLVELADRHVVKPADGNFSSQGQSIANIVVAPEGSDDLATQGRGGERAGLSGGTAQAGGRQPLNSWKIFYGKIRTCLCAV